MHLYKYYGIITTRKSLVMKKSINIILYEKNKIIKKYNNIKAIIHDDKIIFNTDKIKNTLTETYYLREDNDYLFYLNIIKKECTITLRETNNIFDIKVTKANYLKDNNNNISLEYKIESNEETLKICIEVID